MRWFFNPLPAHSFDAVMIDPPWDFRHRGAAGLKSPSAKYDCMSLSQICALPVPLLLRDPAVVWLWCTWPLVAEGAHAQVLRAWGLRPITGGSWAKRTKNGKLRWGTGYVLRSTSEPFILAAFGNHKIRGRSHHGLTEGTAIDGLAREHSRKPEEAYRLFEALTPGARRADIFSRQQRPDWTCWGKEVGKFAA